MEMMERNRKLRLLVTTDCPNKCPMCCNNSWNFDELPRVRDFDYDEVMITGGEPLLFPGKVEELARSIRTLNPIMYPEEDTPKVYIYTSIAHWSPVTKVLGSIDGIVITPHDKKAVEDFILLNSILKGGTKCSLRLNLFKNIRDMLPKDIDLSMWKVKDMEWIKDCPVPKGEDFRRLPELWHES